MKRHIDSRLSGPESKKNTQSFQELWARLVGTNLCSYLQLGMGKCSFPGDESYTIEYLSKQINNSTHCLSTGDSIDSSSLKLVSTIRLAELKSVQLYGLELSELTRSERDHLVASWTAEVQERAADHVVLMSQLNQIIMGRCWSQREVEEMFRKYCIMDLIDVLATEFKYHFNVLFGMHCGTGLPALPEVTLGIRFIMPRAMRLWFERSRGRSRFSDDTLFKINTMFQGFKKGTPSLSLKTVFDNLNKHFKKLTTPYELPDTIVTQISEQSVHAISHDDYMMDFTEKAKSIFGHDSWNINRCKGETRRAVIGSGMSIGGSTRVMLEYWCQYNYGQSVEDYKLSFPTKEFRGYTQYWTEGYGWREKEVHSHFPTTEFLINWTQTVLSPGPTVRPAVILEPWKARIITLPEPSAQRRFNMIQKSMWRRLQTMSPFRLTGTPVEKFDLGRIVRKCDILSGDKFISGDYSAATDSINSEISRAVLDAALTNMTGSVENQLDFLSRLEGFDNAFLEYTTKCLPSEMLKPVLVLPERAKLQKKTMQDFQKLTVEELPFHKEAPGDSKASMSLHRTERLNARYLATKAWEEADQTGDYPRQVNGQLMGSNLSFPVLCVINAIVFWNSCEIHYDRKFKSIKELDEFHPFLINGDDFLSYMNEQLYSIWKQQAGTVGFQLSLGKNFESPRFLCINSTLYHVKLENCLPDQEGNLISKIIKEVPYVNFGLLTGRGKGCGQTKMFGTNDRMQDLDWRKKMEQNEDDQDQTIPNLYNQYKDLINYTPEKYQELVTEQWLEHKQCYKNIDIQGISVLAHHRLPGEKDFAYVGNPLEVITHAPTVSKQYHYPENLLPTFMSGKKKGIEEIVNIRKRLKSMNQLQQFCNVFNIPYIAGCFDDEREGEEKACQATEGSGCWIGTKSLQFYGSLHFLAEELPHLMPDELGSHYPTADAIIADADKGLLSSLELETLKIEFLSMVSKWKDDELGDCASGSVDLVIEELGSAFAHECKAALDSLEHLQV